MRNSDILFFLFGVGLLVFFSILEQIKFNKRKQEFKRKRTKEEKILLFFHKIEPRRIISSKGQEIINEEDAKYSSLLLEYQVAVLLGRQKTDPLKLSQEELKKNEKIVLELKNQVESIEFEVKSELDINIREVAFSRKIFN